MKRLFVSTAIFGMISVIVATACGPGATPAPASSAPKITAPVIAKAAWEEEWEKTLALAQKEGQVSIMSTLPPAAQGVAGPFKEKYGISLEYSVAVASSELAAKADAERRAGLYVRDVIIGGLKQLLTTLGPNLQRLEPAFILPEVQDSNVWRDKRLPFYDKEGKFLLFLYRVGNTMVVNKEIVKPEEITSWRDLLDPKWKGKIVIFDPSISGAGNSTVTAAAEIMGMGFLHELAKQEPIVNRDKRLQLESVARGKYLIGIGFDAMLLEEFRRAGAPLVHVVPAEGTWSGAGTGLIGMFDRAAHPNASKVFVNWFLSKEGQALFVKAAREQSRRLDVVPGVPPDRALREETKYIDNDSENFTQKTIEMLRLVKEIFPTQYK